MLSIEVAIKVALGCRKGVGSLHDFSSVLIIFEFSRQLPAVSSLALVSARTGCINTLRIDLSHRSRLTLTKSPEADV